jgi:PAS domain S-box-containing protein
MSSEPRNILFIEDNPFDFKMISRLISKKNEDHRIEWAASLKDGADLLERETFDALILDLNLPDSAGINTLLAIREVAPGIPVVILTSRDDEDTAVFALKSGAQDYLIKGKIDGYLLERSIRYAIERQQAALHIETQNAFLLSVLESLTHPFLVIDAKTRDIVMANSSAQRSHFLQDTCCYTNDKCSSRACVSSKGLCPVSRVIREKKQVVVTHHFQNPEGNETVHEIHAFPIFTKPKRVAQVVLYFLDITEKEQSKREYQRLIKVVQQSSDSILIMDTHETILYVNPAFVETTGFTSADILGKPFSVLRSHKHSLEFFDNIWDTLNRGVSWGGILISKKKDGSLYEEEIVISPVKDEKNTIINFVCTSRDITSKKRLESIAEAANLMTNIGYIFSGIRHEIGNPINSIKMALTVLNNNLETYSLDRIKEFTERSLDEILRVEYLLKALKNFSMYEHLDVRKVRIDESLRSFVNLVNDDFQKKNIRIDTDFPDKPVVAPADPRALHQVLLNLFTNAADALEGVDEPVITLKLRKKVRLIKIEVRDNGCGIGDDEQLDLFKPFYTSKTYGTGLGLVITKKMLSKMNSTITIQSEKNKGTRAMIFIPEESLEPKP